MNSVKQLQLSDLQAIEHIQNVSDIDVFLKKKGINTDTVSTLICDLYQFATIHHYNLQQKQKLINLTISLLTSLPSAHTKEKFHTQLIRATEELSRRDESGKLCFDVVECSGIRQFLTDNILPYYQLYEIVLDNHPHFQFQGQLYSAVKNVNEKALSSGTQVEVQNVEKLKEFLGIRAPKEEKKDPKKK